MKFIDLFSGIGGFRLGLEGTGHECVGSVEQDKFARKSYEAIFGSEPEWRDIRDVQPGELPEHEMLTGGFPCQSFSVAGERGGFDDTRGTLFFEIMRLAKETKPKYLFLENVRGLFSADNGQVFGTILNTMEELGYGVEWQMLNSKDFGVPQNRERVFIIGHLGGFGGRQVFPIRRKNEGNNKKVIANKYPSGYESVEIYDTEGVSSCLGSQGDYEQNVMLNNDKNKINEINRNKIVEIRTDEGIREFKKTECGTIRSMKAGGDKHLIRGGGIRKLTPKECWRLQGFPDWTFEKAQEVNSDTQLYRQAGNAVTVNVIEAIGERLNE
jgi:DNA (cytosine-5)-methyltransferase 1